MKEDHKPNVALALVLNKDGQVLAVSRKNDFEDFGFPGGKEEYLMRIWNENGHTTVLEKPDQTLKREVYEETGLNISNPRFLMEGYDENGYLCKLFVCDYEAEVNYFEPEIGSTTKHDTGKVKWMDWSDFLRASRSHPEYNKKAYEAYQSIATNPAIVEDGYYMHKRTGETYHIEYITEDNWVMLWSCFNSRPITMPMSFIKDKVKSIPKVTHNYNVYRVADMDVNPHKYGIAERAKAFAIGAHNAVHQEYDDNMYSKHLCDVVDIHHKFSYLLPEKDRDIVEGALWNHDGIEDAMKTWNDLKKKLGEKVAEGAFAMTNEKGRARRDRANKKYYDGLIDADYGEYMKLCDRIANVINGLKNGKMIDGYRTEQPDFKNKLMDNSTLEPMWNFLDCLLEGKLQPIEYYEQYN